MSIILRLLSLLLLLISSYSSAHSVESIYIAVHESQPTKYDIVVTPGASLRIENIPKLVFPSSCDNTSTIKQLYNLDCESDINGVRIDLDYPHDRLDLNIVVHYRNYLGEQNTFRLEHQNYFSFDGKIKATDLLSRFNPHSKLSIFTEVEFVMTAFALVFFSLGMKALVFSSSLFIALFYLGSVYVGGKIYYIDPKLASEYTYLCLAFVSYLSLFSKTDNYTKSFLIASIGFFKGIALSSNVNIDSIHIIVISYILGLIFLGVTITFVIRTLSLYINDVKLSNFVAITLGVFSCYLYSPYKFFLF
ncbi:hypothetical protein JCM19231_5202 [Vibrio ishigakensis]|uniref:Uncharacterized protein n=1 Tax=Vibrio ishigakensis TaxID=1481914 RepID=A0A0B8NZZ8_9VIBR|nr:hypothetical protein [Vibrio ishigakensis]GAM56623.1 hypothetical protein JCM19231_5202 [Vibrio ishigakensis]